MQKTRRILRNLSVINVLLAAAFLLLLTYALLPAFGRPAKIAVAPPKSAPGAKAAAEKTAEPKTVSPADYVVIADKNLFHPDRTIPAEKKEAAAPLPAPEFVLYGTLLTDDLKIAYMEDKKAPQRTATRGNKQIPLRLGETLSGFVLKEIDKDKVVMARGDEKVEVYLNDAARPKTRETAAAAPAAAQVPSGTQPTPVVSTPQQPNVMQGYGQPRIQDSSARANREAIREQRLKARQDRGGLFRNNTGRR